LYFLAISFLVACASAPLCGAVGPDYSQAISDTDAYLMKLSDARLISGTFAVQKAGEVVYSKAFGWASEVRSIHMYDSPLQDVNDVMTCQALAEYCP
jgi:hypothetical protein